MIFGSNFFVADFAVVNWNLHPVKSTVTREELFADEALFAILKRAFERFVSGVRCH